jgi:hypothetical protein
MMGLLSTNSSVKGAFFLETKTMPACLSLRSTIFYATKLFGERMQQTEDLKVFISTGDRDSSFRECGEALSRGAWTTLVEGK